MKKPTHIEDRLWAQEVLNKKYGLSTSPKHAFIIFME